MIYHGIEIFFQNLGNADSIFVRHWDQGRLTNILIDGGWRKSAEQVTKFLANRARETGVSTIHHLVCSHSDDDHAGGLVAIVEGGSFPILKAWVHDTRTSHQLLTQERKLLMEKVGATKVLKSIQESESTRNSLLAALEKRKIPIGAPFAGVSIGPMRVLGPTPAFFFRSISRILHVCKRIGTGGCQRR